MQIADLLLKKELVKFKGNDKVVSTIAAALKDLNEVEVIKLLRLKGRATLYLSEHPIENAALQGARSAGYQEALDDLTNFIDFFIVDVPQKQSNNLPAATFGGLRAAKARGDLTEEEYARINKHFTK